MKKKIMYIDANNLYGWAMSEYLPYDEIIFDRNFKLEDSLVLRVIVKSVVSLRLICNIQIL